MRTFRYVVADVFTDTPLAGNGLAVVHDADGVDDATMLAFARETQLSETSFIQSPAADGATYRNRIWTVGRATQRSKGGGGGRRPTTGDIRGACPPRPEARSVMKTT